MRVLIIEDEKMLADSMKRGLMDEHYAIDLFYNGKDGYEQALSEEYDLILLDIMLPDMDGVSLCRELRAKKIYTPILMLTAKDTIEDKIIGLDSGADDYMVKPFSFEELLARMRSLLRRSTVKSPTLQIDSLSLDPSTHLVKRNGISIDLTGKEYALLEYFMHHPGHILTREQIIAHVWDYSEDLMSNIIDVLIKRLREKIDKAFPDQKPLFTTIRGLGYKLEDGNEK